MSVITEIQGDLFDAPEGAALIRMYNYSSFYPHSPFSAVLGPLLTPDE